MTWVCLLHEALPESHLTPKWLILYAKLNEFGGHAGHLLRHVKMLLNFPPFFFLEKRDFAARVSAGKPVRWDFLKGQPIFDKCPTDLEQAGGTF